MKSVSYLCIALLLASTLGAQTVTKGSWQTDLGAAILSLVTVTGAIAGFGLGTIYKAAQP